MQATPVNTGTRPWENKSDAELTTDVKTKLVWSPLVDADDIEVSAKNGTVTLRGTVDNQRSLDDAIESARKAGVRKVISKLKLKEKNDAMAYAGHTRHNTGTRPWENKSDAVLAVDVKTELFWSPLVDADDIEVWAKDGTVMLRGMVDNEQALDQAVENARDAGAKKVISKLKTRETEDNTAYGGHARHNTGTRPWRNKTDAELKADVAHELAENPFVDADEIEVLVKDGNVLLKGTVENQRSLENAVENARDAGARKVISKLKMREEE
jgi:osmotically-inducible protein OsmY